MEQFRNLLLLALAMILFMIANIIFGTLIANLQQKFDITTFTNGVTKAFGILLGFVAIYLASLCVPDMKLIELGGQQVTALEALTMLFKLGIIAYAIKAFTNMFKLFGLDSKVKAEETSTNIIQSLEENKAKKTDDEN